MTPYVASNDGSVLLSCVTTLALGLIQPHTRLDHFSPGASLITSSADQPKKNESQLNIHFMYRKCEVSNQKGIRPKLKSSKGQINTVCTSKEQSPAVCSKVLTSHDYHVGQCVVYQDQDNTSK